MDFTKQFRAARAVSIPLIALRTFDAASAIAQIKAALGNVSEQTPLIAWDMVHGFRGINKPGKTQLAIIASSEDALAASVAPVEALRMAEQLGDKADAILVFFNSHLVWTESGSPNAAFIQAVWNLRDGFTRNGNMLIMLCTPGSILPSELLNDVLVIDEPLPTAGELAEIVKAEFKSAECDAPGEPLLQKATDALIGLPAFAARQSIAMSIGGAGGKLNLDELWERKRQVIAQTPGCSVHKGTETLADVRGLQSVVSFIQRRMNGKNPPKCILFQDEVEKAFAGSGTDLSGVKTELTGSYCTWFEQEQAEGITFLGLPGVSKSALVKALANEYSVPVILFDIAAMQSGIIGSSGANLRTAQKMVSAISQGGCLVISTCNGIDSVPPEIRRRIGSLGTFFFDAPDLEERRAIFALYREKFNIPEAEGNPEHSGWTGAEIKECCRKADVFGMTLKEAAQYVVPVTLSAAERIEALRQGSSGKFLSASKPGVYMYKAGEQDAPMAPVPVAITGRKIRQTNYDA